ncbi:5-oxoprolinase subunit PxpB [Gramella jeungdoensis]|uniref:5-oxoprolinase subunit PxpB n=1 Tax=Gramella jeungdoensis TaxID=708091 RepID=A0ABT0Z4E4_9FLAO|nr:5-oxoprolinase subunit PxpB [Gramella jeungdoensis]MCM8570593.1 5-oxoprolinase subunit PxpB [Gramella jeungdoensis]
MKEFPEISPMGERAILINFGENYSPEKLRKLLFYKDLLENKLVKEKVEVINTYNSILISYMFTIEDVYSEISSLKSLFDEANIPKNFNSQIFYVPVCYDEEFGPDLKLILDEKDLEIEEIIKLHTAPVYQVYFIGFLPGFLYLGGLDEKLQISRKKTPRKSVEKGSVGIGEKQTGIYPKSSPGGWQILGKCPVELFDKNEDPPTPFSAGDKIKFFSVSREEFFEIEEEVKRGNYKLKSENYEGGD